MACIPEKPCIAVIGLGYVGLPLAVAFAEKYQTIGFDTNSKRVMQLSNRDDVTGEVSADELNSCTKLSVTDDAAALNAVDVFVVTVPTPVDSDKRPDLRPLRAASETVARALKKGSVVVYESTVYPGATEEECVPIIEAISGLTFNVDFFAGYSPERINPGDKTHRIGDIVKVTSGSTPSIAIEIDALYGSIIKAGTHLAPSIKVAEAAKVIENTQRDLNIALVNELSIIFNKLDIDTSDVLAAAGTKWNFLPFKPGLVGGHCIGVDPYYLTHKAERLGYRPEVILAGRRINDGMATYISSSLIKAMSKANMMIHSSRILVLGLAFKEDCPDIRNTKVIDIVRELEDYTPNVDAYDPLVSPGDAMREYNLPLISEIRKDYYDAIVIAVAHKGIIDMGLDKLKSFGRDECILYDVKSIFDIASSDLRL